MSSEDLQVPAEPERRSDADLQKILDSLIGGRSHVLSRDLPDGACLSCISSCVHALHTWRSDGELTRPLVLRAYEREHAIIILEEGDYESLEGLCREHGDIPLGPQEMFGFLR